MNSTLHRYATPFITGLFLISLISGVALFVHVGTGSFRGMHEWLSMVLIVPFVLHVWKNWKPMTVYFKKSSFLMAMAASLIVALAFVYQAAGSTQNAGGPPQFAFAHAVMGNSVSSVAPLLGYTPETLVAQLSAKGFQVTADQTLNEIVAKSGKDEFEVLAAIPPKSP